MIIFVLVEKRDILCNFFVNQVKDSNYVVAEVLNCMQENNMNIDLKIINIIGAHLKGI